MGDRLGIHGAVDFFWRVRKKETAKEKFPLLYNIWYVCLGYTFPILWKSVDRSTRKTMEGLGKNNCWQGKYFAGGQGFLDSSWNWALLDGILSSYLPGTGVNHDPEGGSPRVRLFHCTEEELTSTITPNVGNSSASFLLVGDCVRAIPCCTPMILMFGLNQTENADQADPHCRLWLGIRSLFVLEESKAYNSGTGE